MLKPRLPGLRLATRLDGGTKVCSNGPGHMTKMAISDSFTILGLWVLGFAVSHINESNCKLVSPEHYF